MRAHRLALGLALGAASAVCAACGPAAAPAVSPTPAPTQPVAQGGDPLGPRPALPPPKAFTPAAPTMFRAANGLTVWLVERHALPIVSAALSLPYGASSDPVGKAGLAYMTANMLDEGAGSRGALALSTAVNDLGASLWTGAGMDGSTVSLTVLKKNFRPAFEIFSDVVARPRFEPAEWKRVDGLWKNALEKRAQDPSEVSRVVTTSAIYGPQSVYGHPADGLAATAHAVDLEGVKAFYAAHYRPDKATLVVVGDITKDELAPAIDAALGSWKAQGPAPDVPARATFRPSPPRIVLVDRPKAPQSVIAVVRGGVTASDPNAPPLDLVNTALGGSFTSRLNEDLREEHGWSYGAASGFTEMRDQGVFVARASVVTEATGKALAAMLDDLDKMATGGLTDQEVAKVKAQDRADLVEAYESEGRIARRLATLAALGLPPGFDATASLARQEAPKATLDKLAARVSPREAIIVVVGPAAVVGPQIAALGLGAPALWDAEGNPLPHAGR